MGNGVKRIVRLAVSLVGFIAVPFGTALASPPSSGEAPVIASVVSVERTVRVKPAGQSAWIPAKPQMAERASDHIKTEADSVVALEFVCGGRVGINASSEVELVAPRSAREVTDGTFLKLSSGSIWATLNTQAVPFKITTPSCTLGIRGTEFVVDDADGQTEISVLSGAVEVTDSARGVTMVRPGQVLLARRRQRALLRAEGLSVMRGRLLRRLMRLRRHLDTLPPQARLRPPLPPGGAEPDGVPPPQVRRRRPPQTPDP